ncbi:MULTISPECIES: ABC transporter substrate-binding protein [Campylobacter]|nr:periplasmic binding protein [Campylobacter jejuni subsp. jejuni LMG 23216]
MLKKIFLFMICFNIFLTNEILAKEIMIKDVLGREVKVNLPAKRIIIAFYFPDFLAVGGKNAFDNVVAISKDSWANYMPQNYELFSSIIPKIKTLDDIGDPQFGTFSAEKVIALKPDLLILADWQYDMIKDNLSLIEKVGIPIVVISYNKETLEQHRLSTQILGQLLNQKQRANEIIDFYESKIKYIQEKIAKANLPKPKIYIELGNKGPKENSFTFGNDMWGSLANLVGGENIAQNLVQKWGVISAEQVLASKPDVIVISGRENELNKNKEAMVMGIGIDEKEALKRLEGFKQREGYTALPAIQNHRLYGFYNHLTRTLSDVAGAEFLAKALYPDLFKDLNPNQTYKEFHEKFMPAVPKGTFGIQAN